MVFLFVFFLFLASFISLFTAEHLQIFIKAFDQEQSYIYLLPLLQLFEVIATIGILSLTLMVIDRAYLINPIFTSVV